MHKFTTLSYLTKGSIPENQIWFGIGHKQLKKKEKDKKRVNLFLINFSNCLV